MNPFTNPCLVLLGSYLFAAFFPVNNFNESFLKILQFAVNDLLIVLVVFAVIRTPKDLKTVVGYLSVAVTIALLYGLFSYVTASNPIVDVEIALAASQTEEMKMLSYLNSERGIRLQSLFMSPFIFSLTIVSYLYLILIIHYYFKSILKKYGRYVPYLILLVAISVFLSNSRSAIVPFVMVTPLLLLKMPERYRTSITVGAVLAVVVLPLVVDKLTILTSVFDAQSRDVAGSSLSMRETQYTIALNSFFESPVFGHGLGYTRTLRDSNYDLYGAESVWIPILVEQGVVGVVLYVLFFAGLVFADKFKGKRLVVMAIPVYYLLLVTMNGAVTISLYIVFLALVILYKLFFYYDVWRKYKCSS
ncbi:O-antigen ligase family protein [Niabella sp. CC-SYL272]|uniref:O-antigen ligase family protein n=1 Tax=Niabella agricola TaxID=2891571 RepID=UPI001F379794|nr:O-antigen ligase family protein [Niabella agricola]MCF3112118.1 O-antigen ligase family protein [Niabella agricola]